MEIICVKFNCNNSGLKGHRKVHYSITSQSVPIERAEAKFLLNKRNNNSSPLTHRTKFPLMLPYACTVHKVQHLKLDCAVISFDFRKQHKFMPCQMYVAISRVKTTEGLLFT